MCEENYTNIFTTE